VAEHPGEEMRLAGFLARQGRLDESLDAAQKALPGASLPAVFDTLSALVAARGATPEQTARVEKLLLDALAKYDRPVPLLLTLADLRVRQERFADVEAVYREVLKRDGQNLAALNNLAELLALQDSHNTEALKLIDDAVRLSGPIPTMLDTRATVYLRQGKPQQALADLKQVIAEEPRANRYFHLALAYYQSGQKKAAADAMKQAESMKLSAEQLHPLERPLYERLAAELKQGA